MHREPPLRMGRSTLAALLFLGAAPVLAQDGPWQWEADAAYGYGVDLSNRVAYVGDVRFTGAVLRLGRALGRDLDASARLGGFARLMLEVPMWVSLEPRRGYAVGGTFIGRFKLRRSGRIRPFIEGGSGPIYLAFENGENQADGISIAMQGGPGLDVRVRERSRILLRTQLHHISNAGREQPNPGINVILFTLGVAQGER